MKIGILTISILIQVNSFYQEIILEHVNKIPMLDRQVCGYDTEPQEGYVELY